MRDKKIDKVSSIVAWILYNYIKCGNLSILLKNENINNRRAIKFWWSKKAVPIKYL